MSQFVLIDNQLTKQEDAKISIHQRAFLFGDGIFETCLISEGLIYNFKAHKKRMKAGLKALKIPAVIDNLEQQSIELIKKNQIKNGILRISISRGTGSLGYLPTYESNSLIVIQTSQARKMSDAKIKIGIGETRKPPHNSHPISCKTMQALPYTLNKIEAKERGLFDCVMLSQNGSISETSAANIFWVKDDKIYTPSDQCDILLGTIREKIINNFDVHKVEAGIETFQKADEVFLTNVSNLVLVVNEVVINDEIISFKSDTALKILKWLQKDVKCNQ